MTDWKFLRGRIRRSWLFLVLIFLILAMGAGTYVAFVPRPAGFLKIPFSLLFPEKFESPGEGGHPSGISSVEYVVGERDFAVPPPREFTPGQARSPSLVSRLLRRLFGKKGEESPAGPPLASSSPFPKKTGEVPLEPFEDGRPGSVEQGSAVELLDAESEKPGASPALPAPRAYSRWKASKSLQNIQVPEEMKKIEQRSAEGKSRALSRGRKESTSPDQPSSSGFVPRPPCNSLCPGYKFQTYCRARCESLACPDDADPQGCVTQNIVDPRCTTEANRGLCNAAKLGESVSNSAYCIALCDQNSCLGAADPFACMGFLYQDPQCSDLCSANPTGCCTTWCNAQNCATLASNPQQCMSGYREVSCSQVCDPSNPNCSNCCQQNWQQLDPTLQNCLCTSHNQSSCASSCPQPLDCGGACSGACNCPSDDPSTPDNEELACLNNCVSPCETCCNGNCTGYHATSNCAAGCVP
ncbi:MAG: hypothetical protein HY402_05790 [Elusimicrobia bacterium]|nr:hypothetical protein [Elusimicrobiota bacterium]